MFPSHPGSYLGQCVMWEAVDDGSNTWVPATPGGTPWGVQGSCFSAWSSLLVDAVCFVCVCVFGSLLFKNVKILRTASLPGCHLSTFSLLIDVLLFCSVGVSFVADNVEQLFMPWLLQRWQHICLFEHLFKIIFITEFLIFKNICYSVEGITNPYKPLVLIEWEWRFGGRERAGMKVFPPVSMGQGRKWAAVCWHTTSVL